MFLNKLKEDLKKCNSTMIPKPNQLSSLLFLTALQNFIKIRATVQELTLGTQKDKNRYSRVKT